MTTAAAADEVAISMKPQSTAKEHAKISSYYPYFSDIGQVSPPTTWEGSISPELWGIIQYSSTYKIRQHIKPIPKHCYSWPPCIPQANSYSVYTSILTQSQSKDLTATGDENDDDFDSTISMDKEIMRVDEISDDCHRCCCSPYHPMRLEFR